MERRLTAIVAADVVGFSRLVRDDEDGALAAMASLRRELIEPLCPPSGPMGRYEVIEQRRVSGSS
jgi:hypothetical protein